MKKFISLLLVLVLVLSVVACSQPAEKKEEPKKEEKKEEPKKEEPKKEEAKKEEAKKEEKKAEPEKPGESGFAEIQIGDEKIVGPYKVAAVYFQAVDMIPAGKNPTKEESDMHLEADIHLTKESAAMYGFGNDEAWPAYLTVKYDVLDKDGNSVAQGSFMPMNADDGPHYGTNVKKGLLKVGTYKLKLTIEAPTDYLLHVDAETGVPAKEKAVEFFKTQNVEFDWNYTGEQLQNK